LQKNATGYFKAGDVLTAITAVGDNEKNQGDDTH
jgi:hypothetical protein